MTTVYTKNRPTLPSKGLSGNSRQRRKLARRWKRIALLEWELVGQAIGDHAKFADSRFERPHPAKKVE